MMTDSTAGGRKRSLGEEWLVQMDWPASLEREYNFCRRDAASAIESMASVCRDAWETGLMRGFNGNMSLRIGEGTAKDVLLVTGTGVAKGHMSSASLALSDLEGNHLAGCRLSSEMPMHAAVYAQRPETRSVLHVHPAHLLALSLRCREHKERFLEMPLLESGIWKKAVASVPFYPNGSRELGLAVGEAFAAPCIRAVFMEGHGLCAVGSTGAEALSICEELEHMAKIQLLAAWH